MPVLSEVAGAGAGAGAGVEGKHSSWHWPWGKGKRGEVKNQALVVEVSRAEVGRKGRGEFGKME